MDDKAGRTTQSVYRLQAATADELLEKIRALCCRGELSSVELVGIAYDKVVRVDFVPRMLDINAPDIEAQSLGSLDASELPLLAELVRNGYVRKIASGFGHRYILFS